jgi:hypothetical protein
MESSCVRPLDSALQSTFPPYRTLPLAFETGEAASLALRDGEFMDGVPLGWDSV